MTDPTQPTHPTSSSLALRQRVIAMAASQLGSSDPSPYWDDAFGSGWSSGLSWCGVFVLWVLRMVGLTNRRWVTGRGFIYVDDAGKATKHSWLPVVPIPAIGDIAYFDKPFQHYALVEEVEGDRVHLIAGNAAGGKVARSTASLSSAVYYSIAPLVERAA